MTIASQEIGAFTNAVASGSVTPSGGAVAAVVGAFSASLCEMGCRRADADHSATGGPLAEHRSRLLALADEDALAVDELLETVGDDARDEAVATATQRATEVPLEIATESLAVLEAAPAILADGSPKAAPDVAAGAYLAAAACRGSVRIVLANAETIDDESFVSEVTATARDVEAAATAALERVEEASTHGP